MKRWRESGRCSVVACVLLSFLILGCGGSKAKERTFATPEDAVRALVAAVESKSIAEIKAIVGPDMVDSILGDEDANAEALRSEFVRVARRGIKIQPDPENPAQQIAYLGRREWPFPAPLVREGNAWRFDGQAGSDEVVFRRVGRNELAVITLCMGYEDAQADYAAADRDGDGLLQYAIRINSTPGLTDGLYWSTASGEDLSPVGPFVAAAAFGEEAPGGEAAPISGYWVRLLPATPPGPGVLGPKAEPGALVPVVAWPSEYGFTGMSTFYVDSAGKIYEKDLGEKTADAVQAMAGFAPDASWKLVSEEWEKGS